MSRHSHCEGVLYLLDSQLDLCHYRFLNRRVFIGNSAGLLGAVLLSCSSL